MASQTPVARPQAARSNLPAELTPRERLLRRGPAALRKAGPVRAECLAVLIGNGSPAAPALDQAVDLLRRIGGLPGFLRLDAGNLRTLGLTPVKAAAVASALRAQRRAAQAASSGTSCPAVRSSTAPGWSPVT